MQMSGLMAATPTLLLCSERAGSNLLRLLLNGHPDVYAPNTLALSGLIADREYAHARRSTQGWAGLLTEAARRINASAFYTGVQVSVGELAENVVPGDLVDLYLYPYRKEMTRLGSKRLIIKEHQGWRITPALLERFPDLRIIAQVRDPKDYAISCRKLGRLYSSYHGSIPRAARVWARDQSCILDLVDRFGPDRSHLHKYEDLVRWPVQTLRRICEFEHLSWQPTMLDFYKHERKLIGTSSSYLRNMWANLDRPISSESVGQWQRSLSPSARRAVLRQTGHLLSKAGYSDDLLPRRGPDLSLITYEIVAAARYWLVTSAIWIAWVTRTGDYRVSFDVVTGEAVRAHRPFERFRDRWAYRL